MFIYHRCVPSNVPGSHRSFSHLLYCLGPLFVCVHAKGTASSGTLCSFFLVLSLTSILNFQFQSPPLCPRPTGKEEAFLALRTHAAPSAVWHYPTHLPRIHPIAVGAGIFRLLTVHGISFASVCRFSAGHLPSAFPLNL